MKSWKKLWKEELNAAAPALRADVKNASIPQKERVENVKFKASSSPKPWYGRLFSTPTRLVSCVSACAVALIAIGGSLYFALRPDAPLTATAEVISVEINPQAIFSLDENGTVTAVVAVNDDADILLSEERYLQMEGKTAEEAVKIFVDYAAQLGYLDLENPDAVRITSCAENGRLYEVGDTLKTYFKELGAYVAVAEETLDIEAFCTRANVAVSDSVETLKESVERIPALSFQREAEGKTGTELQEKYRENVSLEEVKELFVSSLSDGEEKLAALEEIGALSDKILQHTDNPLKNVAHYWTLKEWTLTQLSSDLKACLAEMEEKLSAYEENYGVEMDSFVDLTAEAAKCSASVLQTLTDALLNYSLELFEQNFTTLTDLLGTLGVDTTELEEFYELPQTLEEYMQKLEEYTKTRYERLREENLTAYETERAEISEADYEAYLAEMIGQYGSLSEYFEKDK